MVHGENRSTGGKYNHKTARVGGRAMTVNKNFKT